MGYVTFNVRDPAFKFTLAKTNINVPQTLVVLFLIYVVIDIQFIIFTAYTLSFLNVTFFTTLFLSIPMPVAFAIIFVISRKKGLTTFEYLNHMINLRSF
jgi:uncharacterized membrane protein (DUF485 family)